MYALVLILSIFFLIVYNNVGRLYLIVIIFPLLVFFDFKRQRIINIFIQYI